MTGPPLSRNSPCPCGSGRKYKHCCLRWNAPVSPKGPYTKAERERALTRLVSFASRAEFAADRQAALSLYWPLEDQRDERLAEIMEQAMPSFFDWFAVRERLATRQLVRWDLLAARVTEGPEGIPVFEQIPHVFPAELKDQLLRTLRQSFRESRQEEPGLSERTFFRSIAPLLNRIWLERVALPPLPQLRGPEGDPLVITKVHYELDEVAAVREILAAHPGFAAEEAGFVWLEGTDQDRGRRVLGRIELEGKKLRLETWSERRAERGRSLLEGLLGDRLRYRSTSCEDPLQGDRRAPRREKQANPIPPELEAELMQEFMERHYRDWSDQPLPALGGRTPRQAARLKTGRPKVIALLKMMESHAARDRLAGRPAYDTGWLWKELGLQD